MDFPENIENWLETIPVRRKEWFIRYVKKELSILLWWNYSSDEFNEVIDRKKKELIKYMNEENPKNRKHWSKWKKHKERWISYVKGIEDRFEKYWVDYVKLFKEIYWVELKEKNDWYLWLCPIHKENTPSLSVSFEKGVVKCYGCGVAWMNIVNFIRNTSDKKVSEIYWIIEKYLLSKEESEEVSKYWKKKSNNKCKVNVIFDSTKDDWLVSEISDDLPF